MKNRHEHIAAAQHQLELWESRLRELEHEVSAKTESARRSTLHEVQRLRQQRRSLSRRLALAGDAAAEGWMQLKGDLGDAVETFRERASRVLDEVGQ